jgi:dodecin
MGRQLRFLGYATSAAPQQSREECMAKKTKSEGVYRIVDVVGVSETSWEDAGRRAVDTAAGSLRDLRVAEVTKMDMRLDNGKVVAFRTRVALSFKYES